VRYSCVNNGILIVGISVGLIYNAMVVRHSHSDGADGSLIFEMANEHVQPIRCLLEVNDSAVVSASTKIVLTDLESKHSHSRGQLRYKRWSVPDNIEFLLMNLSCLINRFKWHFHSMNVWHMLCFAPESWREKIFCTIRRKISETHYCVLSFLPVF